MRESSDDELRSLERMRLYTIFHPLEADEPLPREQLLASRRHRTVGRRELAGAMWLPSLVVILWLAQWGRLPAALAFAALVLTLAALVAFAFSGGRTPRRKEPDLPAGDNSRHD